jgi:hypothetical protein
MPKFTVQFEIPEDEYEGDRDAIRNRLCADIQSLLYDRAGEDGEAPSRDALAGGFLFID